MRILLVHKFNFVKSGADRYFFDLFEGLSARGFDVAKFSMAHPDNQPDKFEKYFVPQIDFNTFNLKNIFKYAEYIIWNREARKRFAAMLDDFKPDIIHLSNIYHQISPSILPEAKKRGIPIVLHMHDYKVMCPNYKMYNRLGVCERCQGGRYYNCTRNKCLKDSYVKSFLATIEMYIHHRLLKIYEKNVGLYVAPTLFVKDKFIAWGGNPDKVAVVPYFVEVESFEPEFEPGKYFLYYGRLSEEKGLGVLLDASKELMDKPEFKLKIVGSGPLEQTVRQRIINEGLSEKVELIDWLNGENLKKAVRESLAVVVPSEWFEVSGIVIMEAAASGKPVIASEIGGISENINNGISGKLIKPGNSIELAKAMGEMINDRKKVEEMGRAGRELALQNFTKNVHLDKILDSYRKIIKV